MQHADEVRVLLATDEKRGHLREDGPTRQRHEEGGQHCRCSLFTYNKLEHCLNKLEEIEMDKLRHEQTKEQKIKRF